MPSLRTTLSIALTGDEPPSEFCIFTAGLVETTKGTFTFDADAATSVMAEYLQHGIDLMIDYDHASLASITIDPALAGKAAGWFNIEVRNGELWAVNVRWTPPAADALRRKEWRFMSPAFSTDGAGRVTDLLNVAITNLPATRKLQPLMAASMKPENVMAALEALIAGDSEKCAELLKGIIAEAAGASAPEVPAEEPAPVEESAAVDPAADPAAEEDKKEELVAASALLRITGADNLAAAVALATAYRASHIELETERQKLAAERTVLEASERRAGCVDLVVKAGRAPSTVWSDDKCSAPKSYLSNMPMADFRSYVADATNSEPKSLVTPPKSASDANGLSAREVEMCAKNKIDPAKYAATRAGIKARSNVNGTGV